MFENVTIDQIMPTSYNKRLQQAIHCQYLLHNSFYLFEGFRLPMSNLSRESLEDFASGVKPSEFFILPRDSIMSIEFLSNGVIKLNAVINKPGKNIVSYMVTNIDPKPREENMPHNEEVDSDES